MSERAERLRAAFDAYNRGEFEAVAEEMSEEIELRTLVHPEQPLRGIAAVIAWMRPDSFDEQRLEIRELRELGDRIFIETEFSARGGSSGVELEVVGWSVYEYAGEKVRRITVYPERDPALAAAGLAD